MNNDLPRETKVEIQKVIDSATEIAWVKPPYDLMEKILNRVEGYRSAASEWLSYHDLSQLPTGEVSLN